MRVGDKLYSPIILPPGNKKAASAMSRSNAGINPLDVTLSESTCILEELQKQQINLGRNCEPFIIEASGRLGVVCSPYSPMVDDVSLTLYESCHDNSHPNTICKDASFHAALPSSTISRSVAMFNERLFDGLSTGGSFNGSFSGTTELPDADRVISFTARLRQTSNDLSSKGNTLSREDELMMSASKNQESHEQEESEDSGFSVMSPEKENCTPTVKRKTNAGNILKKSRKNYDAKQTTILMDWYLRNDGKAPSSQGKLDLAKATNLNVVQVSTWFQNRKRRYLDTLNEYQVLSRRYPDLVYSYQSYKSFITSEKSSHKKNRK
ncbi:uncharacterized protein ATC70_010298 [Mucor velutinosus]|uniref:Homeobox domain-containing protein n=1 Tax=Mucor velutinosus TaxID=708070 RepID=A0AAN7DF05_9FUNG|nr:hypothetical protein ATC70_010298 [Mucor velutinosus]